MEVWVVIFLCLNVKAVSMELVPGYSTSDFLLAYSSHVTQRMETCLVHPDRGLQLVAAQRNLFDDLPRSDEGMIGITYHLLQHVMAQLGNLPLLVLNAGMEQQRLSIQNLNAPLLICINISFLSPLTPNMLITGRNHCSPPLIEDNTYDADQCVRSSFMKDLENS